MYLLTYRLSEII